MKLLKIKGFLIISVVLIMSFTSNSIAKEVSRDIALQVARSIVDSRFPADWPKSKVNISIQSSVKSDYPFYVCDVDGGGFVLVAKDDLYPPVFGFSFESSFNTELSESPASLMGWISMMKTTCSSYYDGDTSYNSVKAEKTLFIPALMTTKWKVDSSFCKLFPEGSILNSSAVIAMGQVFRYFEKPTFGMGEFCYLYGPQQEELCADFGFTFDYTVMPDLIADEEVQFLLFFMAMAGKVQYSGADLLTYRETLPTHFFYSKNMRAIEYWEHDLNNVLKHQLKMKRPVPAEWKGHEFVIDGYYDDDFFHFNFGLGGEMDGFYLLDFNKATTDKDHFLLKCFVNYHPESNLPAPANLSMTTAGDSLNISWDIEIPDSLASGFDRFVLLRDGVIPILETTSTSVMVDPQDFGISSEFSCIAVYNSLGASELSEPYKYISDMTLANIPSLELRQAINIQLGYEEDLNRIPFVGELELVKKLEIDFQDQRGIDQLTQLKFLFIDGMLITGISDGDYLSSLNYMFFHRCRQFDFSVFESTNSLNVINGSDGLPYDLYDLRHNSNASVITLATHDDIINNMGDLYGIDKYFPNLTSFDLFHITYLSIDSCYISYESFNDILPNIMGNGLALDHVSPSSFVPCYPSPMRNSNVPNTSQISWQSNYDNAPNVFYNVYIGKTRDQLQLTAPFYTDTVYNYNFENNLDYYWRVEAFHSDTTYYSGIYHFSTHESMPMPFIEDFDDYYAKCDVSYESPFWVNFGEMLPEPTALSRDKKRSGRYTLEVPVNSDVGIILEPQSDSAYQIEFYFQNNRTEFSIELLQTSIDGDTLIVNSRIGLFGDNLGTFDFEDASDQFLFTPFEWNHASIFLDMPSGIGILTVNDAEIAQWNWNIQLDGSQNPNPFRGIRFSDEGSTGSGLIDDIQISYTGTTGIEEIIQDTPDVRYSSMNNELILTDNNREISELEIIDLRGRKLFTFVCNGDQRFKLGDNMQNGVFIIILKNQDGTYLAEKIAIQR